MRSGLVDVVVLVDLGEEKKGSVSECGHLRGVKGRKDSNRKRVANLRWGRRIRSRRRCGRCRWS